MTSEKKSGSMNPLLKGVLLFLGGLLILLIILQILVSIFADDYAANRLKTQILTSSDSTYTIDFDDLDLNVFTGSMTLEKVRLTADTTAFSDSLTSSKHPPQTLFQGSIGELDVSGVNVFQGLWGDELHIGSITLVEPNISGLKNPRKIPADISNNFSSVDSSIYAAISNRYEALKIGTFEIRNGHGLSTQSGDTLSSLGGLNLTLQNIRVDSVSAQSGRKFITDDVSMEANDYMINLPDNLNKIRVKQLSISSDNESISVDSLQLIPRYPRFEFANRNGYQIDRIDLTVPKISVQQVDFSRFVDSARFHAQYAEINDATMEDFRNKNLPFPPNRRPPLPHTALRDLGQQIKIDSLKVNNAFIAYNEYRFEAPQAGRVTFENTNATIYNITNYTEDVKNGEMIVADVRSRVMGKGLLNAHFEFPMDTQNGFHKVSGNLGSMNLTAFNPILEYVAFAGVDNGLLNSLEFEMTLNHIQSSGTLVMNYENFKISLLDKKTLKQQGVMENLKTFFANTFIIKENNTPEDGMRPGPIKFERIQRKGVFNYWWKSLLSGIKKSLGA